MELVSQAYIVELKEAEVAEICNALQAAMADVKKRKAEIEEKAQGENIANLAFAGKQISDLDYRISRLRSIRNGFGRLIGRSWMGEDA